ncbi:BTAD domain-containing putative transcriptional regulator [Nocardiopsis trehalosi]|uniref:BTAD domain-containing putative transcriptional regulator n=1 Tax=Nocardiopsis trehalosi TaxID=109329 RepID=UPI000833A512|nr:BTAD domain-containing putative transcriptional regulator [Nocardiopsis trehalosi]
MRVGILGPLRVAADGRSAGVGGPRVRALLARLALAAGRTVGHRALIGDLWPEADVAAGPENPAAALHSLVARLRRALPEPGVLRSEPAGYRLDLPAEAVDAVLFERLSREGRDALRGGQHAVAVEHLGRALDLWRGDPLADVPALPYAEAAAVRIGELRLGAVEDRAEAGIALSGEVPDLAALQELAAGHPLRERLRTLLVSALDAQGRRAEALYAYEEYRLRLAEDLGAAPGPELRALHLRLLREERTPAARHRTAPHGNLRAPLTAFIGREDERALVAERLSRYRMATLVGTGGVGKTRLASVAAADIGGRVWLVELGDVTDPGDVPRAVARTLGLAGPADSVPALVDALSAADTLLVLDCCEHVADAAARLAEDLLGRCPRLRILATSREPLGVPGEALCPVPPLTPAEARTLFTDRVLAVRPDAPPAEAVARICRRLDGLPLAIELAAARLRSMTPEALAAGLDDRFRVLTGGARTAPPRHRTLREVVAWSWDLLTPVEREAAERLSAFASGITPPTAEHVGVAAETLYSLVDRSLLEADGDRYRMLDTIREYGVRRLAATGRLKAARTAHAACFLDLAERAEPHLRGPGQSAWAARLAADEGNLAAALGYARETGDTGTAVRLGAALGLYWAIRGDHVGAAVRLRAVLGASAGDSGPLRRARSRAAAAYLLNAAFAGGLADARSVVGPPPDTSEPVGAFAAALLAAAEDRIADGAAVLTPHLAHPDPWTRAMLLLARAFLGGAAGGVDRGTGDVESAAAAFREAGESWGRSLLLMSLAHARSAAGDTAAAAALLAEASELARGLGTHHGQRVWLAMAHVDTGELDRARDRLEEVVAEAASARQVALARICLADLARHEGDLARAGRLLERAREAGRGGEPADRALYAAAVGALAAASGDPDAAARRVCEAFGVADALADPPMIAEVAVGTAGVLLARGRPERAARVLGAAHALRGGPNPAHPDVARIRRALPDHRAVYDRASRLPPEAALAALREEHDRAAR